MKSLQEIDKEISSLEEKLKNVRGTDTEVYTRIVGYHRAVSNWNKGKREEYDDRLTFKYNLSNPGNLISKLKEPKKEEKVSSMTPKDAKINSYKVFSKKTCRNCPPVKAFLETLSLKGEEIDVSTDLGMNSARKYDVMSTPTVLFFDINEKLVCSASSIEDLKKIFE